MRFAGIIRYLCRKYDSQLFCQIGSETRMLPNDSLLGNIQELIRIFCRPGTAMFFASGQQADDLINELYGKINEWQPTRPDQEVIGLTDPELIVSTPEQGSYQLSFKVKDESRTICCQMLFDAPEQVEIGLPDGSGNRNGSDPADPKQTLLRNQQLFHGLTSVEHIILCLGDFGQAADCATVQRLAVSLRQKKSHTAVISFDWPCHGRDQSSSFHLTDCSQYLMLVTESMHARFKAKTISVYAIGFSAFQVLRYIRDQRNPFHRIVLCSPTLNMYDVLINRSLNQESRRNLLKGKDVDIGLNKAVSKEQIKDFLTEDIALESFAEYCDDICLIHGTADELTSVEQVEAFASANLISNKLYIADADHGFTDPVWRDAACRKAADFFFEERRLDSDSHGPMIRQRMVFHGKVQNVGFRWRVLAFANQVDATGWVRNDLAKTITMEIQSTGERIERVVSHLERIASIQIDRIEAEQIPIIPEEKAFRAAPNQRETDIPDMTGDPIGRQEKEEKSPAYPMTC